MAVTKIHRIKEASGRNPAVHLKKNIFYICDEEKTQNGILIGGNAGRTPEEAYSTMIENKKLWAKSKGSQAFQIVISFPPDCDINEDLAYQFGEEFCQELLQNQYFYIFAVHNNKAHMHIHITFDSVSRTDGRKFNSPNNDWENRIKPIVDRLCKKYNFPVPEQNGDRRGMSYNEWKKLKFPQDQNKISWHDVIRDDIDEAIAKTDTYETFLAYLKNDGYQVTRDGECLSLRPFGRERAIRTGRLGNGYGKEEIVNRIADREYLPDAVFRYKTYGNRQEMRDIIYTKIQHTPGWRMSPLQRNFWRRWNNTYFIRKPEHTNKEQRIQRKKDILEIQSLSNVLRYTLEYNLGSISDVDKRKKRLESELEALVHSYDADRTKLYKKQPFYLVSKYEKLREQNQQSPSAETREEMESLMKKIDAVCPYWEATAQRDELKGKVESTRLLIRDCKKELKLIGELERLVKQTEPEVKKNVIASEKVKFKETISEKIERVKKDDTGKEDVRQYRNEQKTKDGSESSRDEQDRGDLGRARL